VEKNAFREIAQSVESIGHTEIIARKEEADHSGGDLAEDKGRYQY
jgi:hypothetical protein